EAQDLVIAVTGQGGQIPDGVAQVGLRQLENLGPRSRRAIDLAALHSGELGQLDVAGKLTLGPLDLFVAQAHRPRVVDLFTAFEQAHAADLAQVQAHRI